MEVNVDRTKARQIGLTQQDVAQSTLISLTGTGQTAPNEWLNPATGVNYQIVTQTPIYRIDSLQTLARTPVTTPQGNASQLLGNLASFRRDRFAHHRGPLQHSAGLRHLCRRGQD